MQCSGSQDSFAVDHYCGGDSHSANSILGGSAAGGGGGCGQWSSVGTSSCSTGGGGGGNCGGPMCLQHGTGGSLAAPPPPAQSMMSGGVGGISSMNMNGGIGLLGSHMSLGGIAAGGGDTIVTGGGHCRSMSGISNLSIGPPPPPLPPPPMFIPCSSNSYNTVPITGPSSSRWGPRTSCPVHSPFRVRVPNGSICSGHQVIERKSKNFVYGLIFKEF